METNTSLLECFRVLRYRKKIILLVVSLMTLFGVVYSLRLPDIYQAEATIVPIESGGGEGASFMSMSMAGQMGLGGLLNGMGRSNSSRQLLAILKSQTLAEKIILKKGLMQIFFSDLWDKEKGDWRSDLETEERPTLGDAVGVFFSMVMFDDDLENGLIRIHATGGEPVFLAELVNDYVDTLYSYLSENAFSSAKKNRIFIENQLARSKEEFLEAGKELSNFYMRKEASSVESTLSVTIASPAVSEGVGNDPQGTLPKVDIKASEEESGIPGISKAYADIQQRTEKLEERNRELIALIDQTKTVKGVPQQLYLQYLALRRDNLGQITMLLSQQAEMAKIQESRGSLDFHVLDLARVPEGIFKPNRKLIMRLFFIASLFLGTFLAFTLEYFKKIKA